MLDLALAGAAALYGGAILRARLRGRLADSPYASPVEADTELDALAHAHPSLARVEAYGHSGDGRPLRLLRVGNPAAPARLLVTGHIHAGDFVAGLVARAVARALLERATTDPVVGSLLERAQVCVAPLLNPDGAERVWRADGWLGVSALRHTTAGVDPNRNFPFEAVGRSRAWNAGRARRGAVYYRGPYPLSEPECEAVARLAERERFCAAVNFHSFGAVVFRPSLTGPYDAGADDAAARAFEAFDRGFAPRQRHTRYAAVEEAPAAIVGQLDAYLLGAFGTASVTVEVGKPGWRTFGPSRVLNPFWLSNPPDPGRWLANDVDATLHALGAMLDATAGRPGRPRQPGLASR